MQASQALDALLQKLLDEYCHAHQLHHEQQGRSKLSKQGLAQASVVHDS